jgi:hypothetical protein
MNLDLRLFEATEKALVDLRDQLSAELAAGKAQDYGDYRYRVGRIKGLADAYEALSQAQKSVLGVER